MSPPTIFPPTPLYNRPGLLRTVTYKNFLFESPSMKKVLLATIIFAFGLISSGVYAANGDSGVYFGFGGGQSRYSIDDAVFANSAKTVSRSLHPTGAKVFGGYDFSSYLAVEGGYAALRTASATYGYASG